MMKKNVMLKNKDPLRFSCHSQKLIHGCPSTVDWTILRSPSFVLIDCHFTPLDLLITFPFPSLPSFFLFPFNFTFTMRSAALIILTLALLALGSVSAGPSAYIDGRLTLQIAAEDIPRLPTNENWVVDRMQRTPEGLKDMILLADDRQVKLLAANLILFRVLVRLKKLLL